MWKRKGFTLIELLTVISIISLLMAILIPTLSGVRQRARAAVCLSNLRQWGMVYKMYTDEFDGKLPRDYGEFAWYYPIRYYYGNDAKILFCPTTKKVSDPDGTNSGAPFGGTFLAWGHFEPSVARPAWDVCGSYGINRWAYKFEKRQDEETMEEVEETGDSNTITISVGGGYIRRFIQPRRLIIPQRFIPQIVIPRESGGSSTVSTVSTISTTEDPNELQEINKYWDTAYAPNANKIPLVFDSSWLYTCFVEDAFPPVSEPETKIKFFGHSNPVCMDRHNGGINIVFMDFSVRKVALKELWTLKWHRGYNTAGPWTKAGGVQPDAWPKWLQKYKDY